MKAILCHNYRKVKHCPLETISGQEVISFFWHRFLCWLGIREEKVDDSDRDKLPMVGAGDDGLSSGNDDDVIDGEDGDGFDDEKEKEKDGDDDEEKDKKGGK